MLGLPISHYASHDLAAHACCLARQHPGSMALDGSFWKHSVCLAQAACTMAGTLPLTTPGSLKLAACPSRSGWHCHAGGQHALTAQQQLLAAASAAPDCLHCRTRWCDLSWACRSVVMWQLPLNPPVSSNVAAAPRPPLAWPCRTPAVLPQMLRMASSRLWLPSRTMATQQQLSIPARSLLRGCHTSSHTAHRTSAAMQQPRSPALWQSSAPALPRRCCVLQVRVTVPGGGPAWCACLSRPVLVR